MNAARRTLTSSKGRWRKFIRPNVCRPSLFRVSAFKSLSSVNDRTISYAVLCLQDTALRTSIAPAPAVVVRFNIGYVGPALLFVSWVVAQLFKTVRELYNKV